MEYTADIPLSLVQPGIWHGLNQSNGQLELIHNYHLKVGYSELAISTALAAELAAAGLAAVPFGNAVWYDRYVKSTAPNRVTAGIPTVANAVPRLAGVLAYDPALASLQPANSAGIMTYNKGTIIKRGFLRYKNGKSAAGVVGVAGVTELVYATITDAMSLFFENATGDPVFAVGVAPAITLPDLTGATLVADLVTALSKVVVPQGSLKPTLTGCTYGGKILNLYPEDGSVLVQLDF